MTEDYATEKPPTMNVKLLTRVLDHIVAHPETWDQTDWQRCGTTFCFAGHALVMRGWRPRNEGYRDMIFACGNRLEHPQVAAAVELGLDAAEAYELFAYYNTLTDLIDMVESVALIAEMDPEEFL